MTSLQDMKGNVKREMMSLSSQQNHAQYLNHGQLKDCEDQMMISPDEEQHENVNQEYDVEDESGEDV